MLAGVFEYLILAAVATLLIIAVIFIVIMICKFRRKLHPTPRFARYYIYALLSYFSADNTVM